jgi:L-alanine-DL-glutamate epimerase-like enolase superfamily enzyme
VIDGPADTVGRSLGVVTAGTEADARAAVRRYAAAGFQQIKVYQHVPPRWCRPSPTRRTGAVSR